MFKGFQNTSRSNGFNGFPALNFQMNNEAYGFSGCRLWLDANFGTNTKTDLSSISLWTDKINGFRFTQSTGGNQPSYVLSDANFNNLPSIKFNSYVNHRLQLSSVTINMGNKCTVAVVYINDVIADAVPYILCNSVARGTGNAVNITGGGTATNLNGFGAYTGEAASTVAKLSSGIEDTAAHIGIVSSTDIIMDGISITSSNFDFTVSYNTIGGDGSGLGSIRGRIAEIIIFNKSFNSSDCIELSNRLNQKYAIY